MGPLIEEVLIGET